MKIFTFLIVKIKANKQYNATRTQLKFTFLIVKIKDVESSLDECPF